MNIRSKPLLKLYLLAFLLRLIPVLLTIDLPIGLDDMFQYDMLGRSLAAGDGYRWYSQEDLDLVGRWVSLDFILPEQYDSRGVLTSFRAPLYPVFLAIIYVVVGLERRFFYARLAQAFLTAALAPMTYALTRRLFPQQERAARWAGMAIALYPFLLIYPIGLATENLFMPLFLAGVLALLRALDTGRDRDYLLTGLCFAFAMLTRSVVSLVLPLVLLWLWFGPHQRRGALLIAGVAALLVLPWVVRNTLLHGKLTLIESSMGYNLHMGYHPESSGTFTFGPSLELLPYLDDAQRDAIGTQLALGYIKDDPQRAFTLIFTRLGHFFDLERRALVYFYSNNFFGALPGGTLAAILLFFTLPFVLLASLFFFGLPFHAWRKPQRVVAGIVFAYLLPHILILAEPRFHLSLLPYMAALAAGGWALRAESKSTAVNPRLQAWALVALLWFNWLYALYRDWGKLAVIFAPDGNISYFDY